MDYGNLKVPENVTPEVQAILDSYEARNKEIENAHRKNTGRIWLGSALSGASALPVFNIPYVGTGLGGALYELGQGIAEGDKLPELAKRTGAGFAIGETVGAIPYAGKYINKLSGGKIGSAFTAGVEKIASTPLGQKVTEIAPKVEDLLMTDVTGKYIKGYHGTPNKFDKFDFNMVGTTTDDGMLGNGIYFTAYPDVAQTYAKNNGSVKKAILDFKNPFILENKKQLDEINAIIEPKIPSNTIEDIKNGTKLYAQAFRNYLEEQGYDSVIDNIGRKGEQYVAFLPEQIKSGNLADYLLKDSVLTKGYRQNKDIIDKNLLEPVRKVKNGSNIFNKTNKGVLYDEIEEPYRIAEAEKILAQDIERHLKGEMTPSEMINFGKPSILLKNLGTPDLEMHMPQHKYDMSTERKMIQNNIHKVPDEIMKKIPTLLTKPKYVFKSSSKGFENKRFVVQVDAYDKDNNPVFVIVDYSNPSQGINIIPSIYGKEQYNNFINKNIDNIVYKE